MLQIYWDEPYIRTNEFMLATLLRADTERCYFMTDSSTWLAGRSRTPNLKILFQGDPFIVNVYHALCQPPGATDAADFGAGFVDFLVSEKAQRIIREFGMSRYGQALYRDAPQSRKFE